MNGLSTPTIVLLCVFVTVFTGTALVQLGVLFTVLTGVRIRPVVAARRTLGFLERARRDIGMGLVNVVEWAIYGRRYAA